MEPDRQELRAWLKTALEKAGETPTGMARKAGLAQSTLTRFLNKDDAPMLGLRSVAKIAHVAGVQPIGLPGSASPKMSGFNEPEAEEYRIAAKPSTLDSAIKALIDGRSATDPWTLKTRALINLGYMPGDIVIVCLNQQPAPGDIVCAQSFQWSEGRAETVFRVFEPPYLISASPDVASRRPLLVDGDRVIVKGVVIGMVRPSH